MPRVLWIEDFNNVKYVNVEHIHFGTRISVEVCRIECYQAFVKTEESRANIHIDLTNLSWCYLQTWFGGSTTASQWEALLENVC